MHHLKTSVCRLTLAFAVMALCGCPDTESNTNSSGSDGNDKQSNSEPKNPITIKVVDLAGYRAVLEEHRGKVILVDFWAEWCLTCLQNFPHMLELKKELDESEFVLISMCMMEPEEDTKKSVLKILSELQAEIPNLMSKLGGEDEAFEAFGLHQTLPHYEIYDREGKLVRVFEIIDIDKPFSHKDVAAEVRKTVGQ